MIMQIYLAVRALQYVVLAVSEGQLRKEIYQQFSINHLNLSCENKIGSINCLALVLYWEGRAWCKR